MTAPEHTDIASPLALPGSRYPTGWFQVSWSDDIAPGQVKLVQYFGRDIVLWRGKSGKLTATDAYCLHMGANLGVRGTVDGDDIVCPWHGWKWNNEGLNTLIPFSAQKCKENLRLEVWQLREWYGCVLLWHDLAGRDPWWEPPTLTELEDNSCYPISHSMRVVHRIKAHPQMVIENGADPFHVHFIHGAGVPPEITKFELEDYRYRAEVTVTYGVGKESTWLTPNGPVAARLSFRLWGIGLGAVFWPEELLKSIQITSVVPVDDVYSDYYFAMTVVRDPRSPDEPIGKVAQMVTHQLQTIEQDFFTWENMKVLHAPNFAPEEAKHYVALRRWARQFYPDLQSEDAKL